MGVLCGWAFSLHSSPFVLHSVAVLQVLCLASLPGLERAARPTVTGSPLAATGINRHPYFCLSPLFLVLGSRWVGFGLQGFPRTAGVVCAFLWCQTVNGKTPCRLAVFSGYPRPKSRKWGLRMEAALEVNNRGSLRLFCAVARCCGIVVDWVVFCRWAVSGAELEEERKRKRRSFDERGK